MKPGGSGRVAHLLALFVIVLSLIQGCASRPVPAGSRQLVIVAADGATWNLMSPLMTRGRLPRLASLYRGGSAGLLRSLESGEQPVSPAALWTSMATGRPRGAHGIYRAAEKAPGRYALRPLAADRRRAPALWSIASARGLAVGVTEWPVTFPVEPVRGFMIADGYDPQATGDRGYLFPLHALGERPEQEEGLELSAASERIAALDDGLRRSFEQDLASLSRGLALHRVYQPRLCFFRFTSLDLASHRFWEYHERRYLDVAASRGAIVDPVRAAALAEAIPGAYAFFDEWIGLLVERLPEKTTLLIVSDQGFRGAESTDSLHVDLNRLMSRLGYLRLNDGGTLDWSRTQVFSLEEGGGAARSLFLNMKGREAQGTVEPGAAERLKSNLARSLGSLKTEDGQPLFRAVSAVDDPGPSGPEIELVENSGLVPAAFIQVGMQRLQVRDLYRRYGDHLGVHDTAGVLLAAGEGIAAGKTGWSAGLYDLAPTALYLLGLPLASDMPGRAIAEILATPPPNEYPAVPTYDDVRAAPAPLRRSDEAAAQELERLEALGHL